jgi:hypothetical protein
LAAKKHGKIAGAQEKKRREGREEKEEKRDAALGSSAHPKAREGVIRLFLIGSFF